MNLARLRQKERAFTLSEQELVEIASIKQENSWYDWEDVKGYLHIKRSIEKDEVHS